MIAAIVGLLPLSTDIPVDPDAGEARRWIIEELSKPAYQAAQPSWFDRLSSAVWNWLTSLHFGDGGASWPVILIVVVVIAVAVVAAFLIFGAPRLNRRSAVNGALFGSEDERDAAAMRASASAAAASGNWTLAIEELFRAVARALAERAIVTTSPGTTARDFAVRAGHAFPAHATGLVAAARAFDQVRYLGRPGSERAYLDILALEQTLRAAHPDVAVLAGSLA